MNSSISFPCPPAPGAPPPLSVVQHLITARRGPAGELPRSTQVIVVGAGPAGLTAANLLGRLGVQVLLLEASPETSSLPKAVAVDDEYMRLLDFLGLGPALAGHYSEPFGIRFIGVDGQEIVTVPSVTTANGFGRRAAVMQPVFEKILLAGAVGQDSVCVRYARFVEGVRQDPTAVTVQVAGQEIRADYLLACDGAHSFVRKSLGIEFPGSHIDEPHLVVDLAEFPDASPFSRFFCNPRRPFNSIPAAYGGRRIEFMLTPFDDRKEIVSDAGIRRLVDQHTPYAGVQLKIIRRVIYGFAERIAARLQNRRVFLAGDAAHIMPPFGGQGMNTAARDVQNLCWKLAAVVRGEAPASLLDTYDPERRGQIEAIVKYSVWIGRLANIRWSWLARLRDLTLTLVQVSPLVRRYFSEMRYMPRPTISKGLVVSGEVRFADIIGRPFPRLILEFEHRSTPIDNYAGTDFLLVGVAVSPVDLANAARHAFWCRPPKIVSLLSEVSSTDPDVVTAKTSELSPLVAKLRGSICVVRPDRYVAAVSPVSGIMRVLDKLNAKLRSGRNDVGEQTAGATKGETISYASERARRGS